MILNEEYFLNEDTIFLAKDLLGKTLVRQIDTNTQISAVITETEAYHGESDLACHARNGKTPRNQVLYENGGIWYVYLCYGIHWLLNIVTGPKDFPAAVLIRGLNIINGPGRVTKKLQIDKKFNGIIASPNNHLWLEDKGIIPQDIKSTPRIGVAYAGEWALKPWRFVYNT